MGNNVNFVKWTGSGTILLLAADAFAAVFYVYKKYAQNAPWIRDDRWEHRGSTTAASDSTGRCQRIWPTYAVIGWLTKTLTDTLLWLV